MMMRDDSSSVRPDPKHSLPSTYFVQDQSSKEEQQRLFLQDQMLTVGMGGVLPEQAQPLCLERVLDVGCGTGGWLIAMANQYPTIGRLYGIDANKRLVESASHLAREHQVQDRVSFCVMDVLRMLEFPDRHFDLVNQRLGESFLRTWDWQKLLQEYCRVCRPGGILRFTEADLHVHSTSDALEQLFALAITAFFQAGHLFTEKSQSVLDRLPSLLAMHHIQHIQSRDIVLEYRAGTPEWQLFAQDMKHVFVTITPFLRKWTRVPDGYMDVYYQAMREMEQPDFVAHMMLKTVWGKLNG